MLNKKLILALAAAAAMSPGIVSAQTAGSQQSGTTDTQAPAADLRAPGASSSQPLDFSQIPGLDRPPKVQIDLTPTLLSFASAAAQGSQNADMAKALSGVRSVRVYVYDVGQNAKPVLDFVEASANTLEREGWQRAVYVQDESDKVRLYVKSANSQIAGLTMMVVEQGGEAVFINVDGKLDPAMLGRLAASMGAGDVLGKLGQQRGAPQHGNERAPKTSDGNAPTNAPESAAESAPQTQAE